MRPDEHRCRPDLTQLGEQFLTVFHISEIRFVVSKETPNGSQLALCPGRVNVDRNREWRAPIGAFPGSFRAGGALPEPSLAAQDQKKNPQTLPPASMVPLHKKKPQSARRANRRALGLNQSRNGWRKLVRLFHLLASLVPAGDSSDEVLHVSVTELLGGFGRRLVSLA